MFKLSKINPMARAIGTMGAIAAITGGVTFAALTSNTVALTDNTLSTATANLIINDGSDCTDGSTTSAAGISASNLQPGTPQDLQFCIRNRGTAPLNLTVGIPQTAFLGDTDVPPSAITLDISCDNGGHTNGTLDQYTGGSPLGTLAATGNAGDTTVCTAAFTLNNSYSGSGGSVPAFDIDFVGNA